MAYHTRALPVIASGSGRLQLQPKLRKDGLPDPKASLTSKVPTRAIVRANREVEAELIEQKKKRGPYVTCTVS